MLSYCARCKFSVAADFVDYIHKRQSARIPPHIFGDQRHLPYAPLR